VNDLYGYASRAVISVCLNKG